MIWIILIILILIIIVYLNSSSTQENFSMLYGMGGVTSDDKYSYFWDMEEKDEPFYATPCQSSKKPYEGANVMSDEYQTYGSAYTTSNVIDIVGDHRKCWVSDRPFGETDYWPYGKYGDGSRSDFHIFASDNDRRFWNLMPIGKLRTCTYK